MPLLRLDLQFRQVRDGYLTGRATLFGKTFEAEAFRVIEGRWQEPDNKRPARMVEVLKGLLIDDVPLNQVQIPGHEGSWLLVLYPGENEEYRGPRP